MQEYFVTLKQVVQSEESVAFPSDVSDDDAIYKSNNKLPRILHALFRALSRGGLQTIACFKMDNRCYISIFMHLVRRMKSSTSELKP